MKVIYKIIVCLLVFFSTTSSFGQEYNDKEIGFNSFKLITKLQKRGVRSNIEIEREVSVVRSMYKKIYKDQLLRENEVYNYKNEKPSIVNRNILDVPQSEKDALQALFNNTGGANWINKTGWDFNVPVSNSWYGVIVENGFVVELNLHSNNLIGALPDLSNLTQLRALRLSTNNFSSNGQIPIWFNNFTNLKTLWLYNCQFQGLIPNLSGLINLQELQLNNNNFSSVNIPTWIYSLTNLRSLGMSSCNLNGSISSSIGNLQNLQYFQLGNNELSGSIPPQLCNLIQLQNVILYDNNFTGQIPSQIGQLLNLQSLLLSVNQLSLTVPSSISSLTKLNAFWIDYNNLEGVIPSLTNNTALSNFRFNNNKFRFLDFATEYQTYKNNVLYFAYAPQDKIDTEITVNGSVSGTTTLKMCEDGRFINNVDTFQWFKGIYPNGVAVTNESIANRQLTLSNLTTANAGDYYCLSKHPQITSPIVDPIANQNLILVREPIHLVVNNCTSVVGESKYDDCGYFKTTASSCPYTCGDRKVYPYFSNAPHTNVYKWTFKSPSGAIVGTIQNNFGFINEGFIFTTPGNNTIELTITTPDGCITNTNIVSVPVIKCCTPLTGDIIIVSNTSSTSSSVPVYYEGIWNAGDTVHKPEINSWVDYLDQYGVQKRFIVGPLQNGCQGIGASKIIATNGVVLCDNAAKLQN